jgi:MSHA pilin protein MshD
LTLIEVTVAIVIIATAAATLLGLTSTIATRSADAMVASQATSIASAYLSEIIAKPYADPDGGVETDRAAYDDIGDYLAIDTVVRDSRGVAVPGLGGYQVHVAFSNKVNFGVPAVQALLVTVNVTDPLGHHTSLGAYKTSHP